ncbi:MAG: methionyl-tRNA formyltransferase, partial [Nitriliruptorales bacterium]
VKTAAVERGLEVRQPARPVEIVDELESLGLDAAAVVAYGALLPRRVLEATRHGFVNLHFSLLPRWRGAAPVQHAIRAGDEMTGITTFVLDEGMDTGAVLVEVEVAIEPDETAGELTDRLAEFGAGILVRSLRAYANGEIRPSPQPDDGVTYAPKIGPDDAEIDWEVPATSVAAVVRSANPAPGAHTTFRGERLKVWRARPAEGSGPAGTVTGLAEEGPVVAAGRGAVVLTEVQPAGKRRIDGRDFANGYQPVPGEPLGGS